MRKQQVNERITEAERVARCLDVECTPGNFISEYEIRKAVTELRRLDLVEFNYQGLKEDYQRLMGAYLRLESQIHKQEQKEHVFNDDAVCINCGFDSAEWHHLRRSRCDDGDQQNESPPKCTNSKS